jgi:predicted nucleic acid-binding protein
MRWAGAHYLDASALVKLVADDPDEEPGREVLRDYFGKQAKMLATSYCVAEAFSVFKLKFVRGKINSQQYVAYLREFVRRIIGGNLEIDEISVLSPVVLRKAERLIAKYQKETDFIDCLQIVTVLHGQYCHLGPNSKSVLITADGALAEIARNEGVTVWLCTSEPSPD